MDQKELQRITNILLSDRMINHFDSKKYVDWAILLIQNGYQSEHLFILAGLDNEDFIVIDRYFAKAVSDLGITITNDKNIMLATYAEQIALDVINEDIAPLIGLDILTKVYWASDSDSRYKAFANLKDDFDYFSYDGYTIYNSNITKDNQDSFVKNECALFLEMPDFFTKIAALNMAKYVYCASCHSIGEYATKSKRRFYKKINIITCPYCGARDIYNPNDQITRRKFMEYIKNRYQV